MVMHGMQQFTHRVQIYQVEKLLVHLLKFPVRSTTLIAP